MTEATTCILLYLVWITLLVYGVHLAAGMI